MPKRKAKYLVNTTRAYWYNDFGRHVNVEDSPFLADMGSLTGYREKPNPRIKTKHPHKSYRYPYIVNDHKEGKASAINWTFTTEGSARRFTKNKTKHLSQKYRHYDDVVDKWMN